MTKNRTFPAVAALLGLLVAAACGQAPESERTAGASSEGRAQADGWTYTDGSGETVTLEETPTTILAHASSAAALLSMGIRPAGIYADAPVKDDFELREFDLEGIEIVGETWGEIDIEKVVKLEPDLIVAEWWPLEKTYSGLEPDVSKENQQLPDIAPIVGVKQGDSILTMLEDYEELAVSLGADPDAAKLSAAKTEFEDSLAKFKEATAAKPDLSVLAVSPTKETLYVAAPEGAAELSDFARWGMQLVAPEVADDRGYWETLSWENADKYQVDLVLVDDRYGPTTLETAEAQPTWTAIEAAKAGAVADWPAFWVRTYGSYAEELAELTAAVEAADEGLT